MITLNFEGSKSAFYGVAFCSREDVALDEKVALDFLLRHTSE
jgi:hypothetical protein